MREIEIKARIDNPESIIKLLAEMGYDISEPVTQRDQVFGVVGVKGDSENHEPWLRIRSETKHAVTRYILTLKKSITSQLDSIEHETDIADPIEMEQIILHMNFEPYSDLTKTRQKTKIGDIEICLDRVDGLGDFIEAEKLVAEDSDVEQVNAELWDLFLSLSILRSQQVTDGYDVLANRLRSSEPRS